MDKTFQDRTDRYLLHRDLMTEEEQASFLQEIADDDEKREQYELTCNVKTAITSRAEKLKLMADFQKQYEARRTLGVVAATPRKPLDAAAAANEEADEEENHTAKRRKMWMWASGIAAIAILGYFLYVPSFDASAPGNEPISPGPDIMRDADDEVFDYAPAESAADSFIVDSTFIKTETEATESTDATADGEFAKP